MAMIDLEGEGKRIVIEDSRTTGSALLKARSAEDVRISNCDVGLTTAPAQAVPEKTRSALKRFGDLVMTNLVSSVFALLLTAALTYLGLSG